jgi:hypothetical protein
MTFRLASCANIVSGLPPPAEVSVLSKKAGNLCQKSRPIVQNTGGEEFVRNLLIVIVREASHIDFVHEKRHMFVSMQTPPPPPPPPLETSHIVIDILFL